jgi:hypothetical protein
MTWKPVATFPLHDTSVLDVLVLKDESMEIYKACIVGSPWAKLVGEGDIPAVLEKLAMKLEDHAAQIRDEARKRR